MSTLLVWTHTIPQGDGTWTVTKHVDLAMIAYVRDRRNDGWISLVGAGVEIDIMAGELDFDAVIAQWTEIHDPPTPPGSAPSPRR